MKIFVQHLGYRGAIIVVAETEEQARELMKANSDEYVPINDGTRATGQTTNGEIESYPIQIGYVCDVFGDR